MGSGIDLGISRERERVLLILDRALRYANERVTAAKTAPARKAAYGAFDALTRVRTVVAAGQAPPELAWENWTDEDRKSELAMAAANGRLLCTFDDILLNHPVDETKMTPKARALVERAMNSLDEHHVHVALETLVRELLVVAERERPDATPSKYEEPLRAQLRALDHIRSAR